MSRGAVASGGLAALALTPLLAACAGDGPPAAAPEAITVGAAVLEPVRGGSDARTAGVRPLDAAAVGRYFSVRLPPGTDGVIARYAGFMDDTALARLSVPAGAADAFVREAGLRDDDRCGAFTRRTLGNLRVGPVAADGARVRCFTASAPDAGSLAERTIALVDRGARVEVLLSGFTT